MMRIRISDEAFADLDDGYWFYEDQETGIGDYFAATLRGEIEELRITAGIHRRVYRDYHRFLSRVFPYAVYYTLSQDEIIVWGIIDCRRDPEWIRDHLDH
jgi:plasmid stabilization system protein ParE